VSEADQHLAPAPALEIDAQAADFLARRANQPRWTEKDAAELEAWLSSSLAHQTAFWRLESVWERANRLDALRQLPPRPMPTPASPRRRSLFLGLAASVAVVAAIGLSTNILVSSPRLTTYATPIGGRESIHLADGSQIDLNTDTVLRTHFKDGQRSAELVKGEALFQIKHDAAHPFVVSVAGHTVTDLGTKFLVHDDGSRLKVALIEGSARLSADSNSAQSKVAVLMPGDEAVATSKTLVVTRKTSAELRNELGWNRGVLVFHRATLFDVAKEYNRYNQRKIVIADDVAGARVINATLSSTDVAAFARMAKNFLGLHVEEREREIVISR
jgi:transmembrane sensor